MGKKHLMFDIETLSTKPDAIVLSIGAVLFNKHCITDTFYVNLSMKEQLGNGRSITESTFYWWMQQAQEASAAVTTNVQCVGTGLMHLMEWLTDQVDMETLKVWGNGATFDNVIMRHLLESNGYTEQMLWKFWNDRCFRTYVAENKIEKVHPDVAHHALADARAQAMTLIRYWSK